MTRGRHFPAALFDETRPVNSNPDEITIGDFAEEIITTGTDQKVVYRELPKTIPSNAALTSLGQRKFWIGRHRRPAEGLKRTYAFRP